MTSVPCKPPEHYVYIFVRQDLPIVHQIVQTNHATLSVTAEFRVRGIPNIVLIGVPDTESLETARRELCAAGIRHWAWTEPDFGFGFTSIATEPIQGEQRQALAHYRTWKESSSLSSPSGKAVGSNPTIRPFESVREHHTGAQEAILAGLNA